MLDNFKLMGDPHLSKRFKTGVSLDRVGEREASVWKDFRENLMSPGGVDFHVCMGDLFDKFVVPPEILLKAFSIYQEAASARRDVEFIVIRGNHDVSRDTSKKSSFDLFTLLVEEEPNITVINEVKVIGQYGFVPYCPFSPVEDQVKQLPDSLEILFMHHDYADWGGDHVIPTQLLKKKKILLVVDGHDHLARTEKRHGVTVKIVGSLQPFTHAEDGTGEFYKTVTLADLEDLDTENLNIRVLLREGETLPADLDCLSLTAKRITDEDEKIEVDTSEFETLDLKQMLANALDGLTIKDQLMEEFENDQ